MTPGEELRYLVLGAQREGNRLYAAALKPLGLTPAQAEVLTVLAGTGTLSLLELGRRLVCESGSPSRLIDALVRAGLVRRTVADTDRRRVELSLTPAGAGAATAALSAEDELSSLIESLLDPGEMGATVAGLRRLVHGRPAGDAIDLLRARPGREGTPAHQGGRR